MTTADLRRSLLAPLLLAALAACSGGASTSTTPPPPPPPPPPPSPSLSLLAGSLGVPGSANGTGPAASFNDPAAAATDAAGNLYVADTNNHTIRKITSAGVVTTLAGTAGVHGGADGTGTAASFYYPSGVATDSAGNVYVADNYNHAIRRITPAGVVTTLAGTAGAPGYANGTGAAARFQNPCGVAVDGAGNVFVADTNNSVIRLVSPSGLVSTLAGVGGARGTADGIADQARFDRPQSVAVDATGHGYVADTFNYTIRKIDLSGAVTTVAGWAGHAGTADGTGMDARFGQVFGIAMSGGDAYVADSQNATVRRVTPAGVVTTVAGAAGVPGSVDASGGLARFIWPEGIAFDAAGTGYVTDAQAGTVRKIDPAGAVTTLAGTSGGWGSADGVGPNANFNGLNGVAADGAGNVYVADYNNQTIRKITPAGVVSTLAGAAGQIGFVDGVGPGARFSYPYGLAIDGAGNLYVTDPGNQAIRKVTPSGAVTTLAGGGPGGAGSSDGLGPAASFNWPQGMALDGAGNLYVADTQNHLIRKVTPAGLVSTLAGTAGTTGSSDGAGALALFNYPQGVAVDGAGNLLVADGDNRTIRRITPAGVVSTLAGTVGVAGTADGTGAAASFGYPQGLAIDGSGNAWVADSQGSTVRRVSPLGVVTTVVGQAGQGGFTPGTLPGLIPVPLAVTVRGGSLYVTSNYGVAVVHDLP